MSGRVSACRYLRIIAAILAVGVCGSPVAAAAVAAQEAETYVEWVTKLASPQLEGRGVGTEGIVRAREYIAAHFKSAGLKGAFDGGMTQKFEVRAGVRCVRRALSVVARGPKGEVEAKPGEDFVPFGFSASQAFRGEAVFVGYAIASAGRKYSSLGAAGKDAVRGKVAVALRYEPHDAKGKSLWTQRAGSWSREAGLIGKAGWAAKHGAAALLIVNPPSRRADGLVSTSRTAFPAAKVPVLHVTEAFLKRILTAAGRDEKAYQKLIDKANGAGGVDPLGVTLAGRVELKPYTSGLHNVAAVLPGSGKLADEYVIVGAHYDHIGFGRSGRKRLHPGADDNASGTAGVMMLAKCFSRRAADLPTPRRTIVFVTFAGEEIGLRGSRHMVAHPADLGIRREQITAMVNMDMIGRLKDDRLAVWGVDSGKGLRGLVGELGGKSGLKLRLGGSIGPSDHAAFYTAKVPVVGLITGIHRDMHRPTDTADKINGEGAVKVLRFAETLVTALATRPERIAYTPLPPRSRRAYLGVMPDPSADRCRLARIVPDGPADKAGLRDGDVLVTWAGKPIADVDAMRAQLARSKPGQKVRIQLLRGTEKVDLTVRLGGR